MLIYLICTSPFRNIAILFPLRAKYLCTRGHAHMVIGLIWLLSFAMAAPVLIGQVSVQRPAN